MPLLTLFRCIRLAGLSRFLISLICFVWACSAARCEDNPPAPAQDLTKLSIEDLMKIEVTSVSKKAEPFFKTPAAIYVVTQEDIRRSGATSIPEALRMVPGVQVARIDANKWAVSIRGFNNLFADKLLVL